MEALDIREVNEILKGAKCTQGASSWIREQKKGASEARCRRRGNKSDSRGATG